MKIFLLISTTLFLFIELSFSQQVPTYQMQPYKDSTNTLYWNKHQEVFISVSTTKNGKKENLTSTTPKYDNPFFFDTEGVNYIRTRWAVDKKTKEAILPKQEIQWSIYADSKAPNTKLYFTDNDSNDLGNKKIYGKNLKIVLKATDKLSGLKIINYSINNSEYKPFTEEIIIEKQGEHTLNYFSVDNVGNVEKLVSKKFSIDIESPVSNCTIQGISSDGKKVFSIATKIYINANDNISGVAKTYYSIDGENKKLYNGKKIPLSNVSNGTHKIDYYSIDKVNNIEETKVLEFYLDKISPLVSSDILGDRFVVNEKVYFSGKTKLKLTAIDNRAGVKNIRYAINKNKFQKYTRPFYLPSKQGVHTIKYFAADSVENSTGRDSYSHKISKYFVDLTGPSLSYKVTDEKFYARDTLFIGKNAKIHLKAYDKECGLKYISYSVDGEQREHKYIKPFSIEFKKGLHKIEYFGYDNVNNRNIAEFSVYTDAEGPEIKYIFSIKSIGNKDGLKVYPNYAMLFLSAYDRLTDISKIYYSLNGQPEILFTKFIKGFKENEVNTIKIRAYDILNNLTTTEYKFFIK